MKTKRWVGGGKVASANGSAVQQSAPLVLALALLGATSLACKLGSGGDGATTGADQSAIGATAQGTDIVRYAGLEVVETGQSGIRQAVQARRAADWSSPSIATLYAGTLVTRMARYGNFSLVSWTGAAGTQQGWVDANLAFTFTRPGAVSAQPPTVFGTPTATTPPTATAPPTVTAPPTATTPPKPTATTPPTPPKPTATTPPPKPTATTPRTGFKPPKLN